jgi:hypothetical protein
MEVHVCRHRLSLAKEVIVHAKKKKKKRKTEWVSEDNANSEAILPNQKENQKERERYKKRNRKRHDDTYNPTTRISDLTARWVLPFFLTPNTSKIVKASLDQ